MSNPKTPKRPYADLRCHQGRNDLYFLSGQIGAREDPDKGLVLVDGGVHAQTLAALENVHKKITTITKDMGWGPSAKLDDVIKCTLYIVDIAKNYSLVNEAYLSFFTNKEVETLPARTVVGVAGLPLGALIEIDVIASVRDTR